MKVLITGGAGFIGSNLVSDLLRDDRCTFVRVLDNLATGFEKNLEEFHTHPKFEFVKGDIRNYEDCLKACEGINRISHQAALGSVPRSVNDPITTNEVNIGGTLNIFNAARENKIDRVIYAASSSTYGDSQGLPKVEDKIGNPLSPYAVTKYVMELYAKVFNDLYSVDFVGFRYFNVYGPKQDPNGAYAAVIPLFFKHALDGTNPTINGDGSYSRDFTYVRNVVKANVLGLTTTKKRALNQVYNIACGDRTTLLELWDGIKEVCNSSSTAIHGPNRAGDIPHSLADVSKAIDLLEYHPKVKLKEGLQESYNWYNRKNI
jgi:UDP-N-acetylglucosamine 4-epimerase